MRINKTTQTCFHKSKSENKTINEKDLKYFNDVFNVKFNVIKDIFKQPTKSYKLMIPDNFKKEIKGDLFIRNEYQNIYCIYGKIEITSNKPINPILILPDPHRVKYSIVVKSICFNEKDKILVFVDGTIFQNSITFYPGNHLKPNIKTTFEFNELVSLPGEFPLHIKL